MLNLASTTDLVRITTTAATATLTVQASWVNLNGTTVTPGRTNTPISGAVTNTTIVAAPAGASDYKTVKGIDVFNTHATLPQVVEVNHFDNTNSCPLWKGTLLAGEHVEFDGTKWQPFDAAGNPKIAGRTGLFLKTTVLTSGTSFVTGPNTNSIYVRAVGPGGGGGGVALNAAGNGTVAGGGAAGSYGEKTFAVSPNTAYTYAIGAAGGAGASGGGTGGAAGGATTFAVGATTLTCPSGLGGTFIGTNTTHRFALGGASGAAATNGDVNAGGEPGFAGCIIVAGVIGLGGQGGHSPFGSGGESRVTTGAGVVGKGFGSGGSGALSLAGGAAAAGGAGTAGVIIVDEFA